MWLWNWFQKFFFLDELNITTPRRRKADYFFTKETDFLVERLSEDCNQKITYEFDFSNNIVLIKTATETFAVLRFCLKGKGRLKHYLVVELEPRFDQGQGWFQLAFVTFHVCFKKPVLQLLLEQEVPREL